MKEYEPIEADEYLDSRQIIERLEYLKQEQDDLKEAVDDIFERIEEFKQETGVWIHPAADWLDTSNPDWLHLWRLRFLYEDLAERDDEFREWLEEHGDELEALQDLEDQSGNIPDWEYGAQLIRDDKFAEHAEETARDIYDIKSGWPFDYIDWDAAAEALQQDYTCIRFMGEDYWVRA